ncbi:hypothetical protein PG991_006658 [Apiospora marii]|uniref:F-box domain-containing protein n=1 Tax=Apiospora marii TaxID=335849 RepID=A0ABR1S1Y9_9PEZI
MASLSRLPPELSLQVFSYLNFGDKVQLSATCKEYRRHFAPEIFATIRFTNEENIAQSALAAVKAHGKHTVRIEFTPSTSGPGEEPFAAPALVPAASELLQGRHTPNARAVQIHFAFDFDNNDYWNNCNDCGIYVFEEEEDEDDVEDREQNFHWRALMSETWAALSENVYVTDLTVKELVPKSTSAFLASEFCDFLGRFESATLSIWGSDDGAGRKSCTTTAYVEWLSDDLGGAFFRHMANLKHLAVHASMCGPLGCDGLHHIPLGFKSGDLPVLESLTLTNCYVGPELVHFLCEHAAVLKRLDIDDCVSAGANSFTADNPLSWAEFFNRLCDLQPSALAELVVGGAHAPLTVDWDDTCDGEEISAEAREVRQVRQKLEEEPGRKLFAYYYQDDKYGTFLSMEEEIRQAFLRGDDQRAYDRLMGLVRQNAARAGASWTEAL